MTNSCSVGEVTSAGGSNWHAIEWPALKQWFVLVFNCFDEQQIFLALNFFLTLIHKAVGLLKMMLSFYGEMLIYLLCELKANCPVHYF